MNYFEHRTLVIDDRTENDWDVIKLLGKEGEIPLNSISELDKNDYFIIQNSFNICPIPHINNKTTCFQATGKPHLSLDLPEGTIQINVITSIRYFHLGGIL